MPFETKNGSISILYDRQSHDPLDTHTHASINNAEPFQVCSNSNSVVLRNNPRDSRNKFSLRPPFLKPWSKRDPGVRWSAQTFPTFLPFVKHYLFRDWKLISIKRLCIVQKIGLKTDFFRNRTSIPMIFVKFDLSKNFCILFFFYFS
jgi:hypothetical protein